MRAFHVLLGLFSAAILASLLPSKPFTIFHSEPAGPRPPVGTWFVDFFGPESRHSFAMREVFGPELRHPGSALTASTRHFRFDLEGRSFSHVELIVVWTPQTPASGLQLFMADDGPSQIETIVHVKGEARSTPIPKRFDVTETFNRLVREKKRKHVGFRVQGDGIHPPIIYHVGLAFTP